MAQMSSAEINNLPDSDFAYIEPGGSKDGDGKTTPRSLRHFPIHDAAHVRNALARIAQGAKFGDQALPKVRAAAKKFGIDTSKALGLGFEVKSFALKLDSPPDDEGHFTGYASVFGNVDKGNDVVEPGAVTKTLQENPDVPIFWSHNYGVVPIGTGRMTPDAKGVRIDGDLFLETSELAREVFGAMKAGAVKGLSIGYNTLQRTFKGAVRHLQEITIGEVSLCPFPMNPLAGVDAVKDLRGYEDTDGVSALLCAIRNVSDFMVGEVQEGDTDDAGRSLAILNSLAKLLTSELSELAAGTDGDNGQVAVPDVYGYSESMSAAIDGAIKSLEALRDGEAATGADDGPDHAEPAVTTLRELAASIRG